MGKRSLAQYPFAHLLSNKARLCEWDDYVIVDEGETIFEGAEWVRRFIDAPTANIAMKIFNSTFEGRWKMLNASTIEELSAQSWQERYSLRHLFRQKMDIYIKIRINKDMISSTNISSYVNRQNVGKVCNFSLQSTLHDNLLISAYIAPEHPDSDTEYVYAVYDKDGNILLPYHCASPWDYVLSQTDRL